VLGQNDIWQTEKHKTCVVIMCLHGLTWNGIFRGGSLFSWIGNFFRFPQVVVDISSMSTWQFLRFDKILCKVLEAWFLLPYTCTEIVLLIYRLCTEIVLPSVGRVGSANGSVWQTRCLTRFCGLFTRFVVAFGERIRHLGIRETAVVWT